jgi:MFS family permease
MLITRFFTGLFASAPVTNTGGVLGDVFSPAKRASVMVGYSMAVAGRPLLAPIVGGAIVTRSISWRWVEYVCCTHSDQ